MIDFNKLHLKYNGKNKETKRIILEFNGFTKMIRDYIKKRDCRVEGCYHAISKIMDHIDKNHLDKKSIVHNFHGFLLFYKDPDTYEIICTCGEHIVEIYDNVSFCYDFPYGSGFSEFIARFNHSFDFLLNKSNMFRKDKVLEELIKNEEHKLYNAIDLLDID